MLLAIIAVIALMLRSDRRPRPMADTVRVNFHSYTTAPSGTLVGVFIVTNPAAIAIKFRPYHEVQTQTTNGWASLGLTTAPIAVLQPGQAFPLQITAPIANIPWRVWLNYMDKPGPLEKLRLILSRSSLRRYAASSDTAPARAANDNGVQPAASQ
jgi:hypothetical protein